MNKHIVFANVMNHDHTKVQSLVIPLKFPSSLLHKLKRKKQSKHNTISNKCVSNKNELHGKERRTEFR